MIALEPDAGAEAIGGDHKGEISIVLYFVGTALSRGGAWLGFLVYAGVATLWLIPDRRIEEKVVEEIEQEEAATEAANKDKAEPGP